MQLGEPTRRRRPLRVLLLALFAAAAVAFAIGWLRVGPPPQISIEPALPGIGKRTPIVIRLAAEGRGLAPVRIELVQGERVVPLAEKVFVPRSQWRFWGPRSERAEITVEAGRETVPELKAGEATVRVVAQRAATWLRRPAPATAERVLPVRLVPPTLQVLSLHTIVAQGGSEAVVYRVDQATVRDGVEAGTRFFRGHPLPGGAAGERFALFAVPYDMQRRERGAAGRRRRRWAMSPRRPSSSASSPGRPRPTPFRSTTSCSPRWCPRSCRALPTSPIRGRRWPTTCRSTASCAAATPRPW